MNEEKDKLNIMFEYQNNLQKRLGNWDKIKNNSDKQQYVNQMILALHEEATEIMRESAYKNPDYVKFGWKKGQQWNEENFKEELIDLLHIWINLCLVVNFKPEEILSKYEIKNNENVKRKENNY